MDGLPLIASFDATNGAGPNLLEPSTQGASAAVPVYPPPQSSAVESHPKRFFHHGVSKEMKGRFKIQKSHSPLQKSGDQYIPAKVGGCNTELVLFFIMMMDGMKKFG